MTSQCIDVIDISKATTKYTTRYNTGNESAICKRYRSTSYSVLWSSG